jgi:hypothetical protein
MSTPLPGPAGRRVRSVGYVLGGPLLVAALVLCCGVGGWFISPVMRANQDVERAVIGLAIFDMHDGDEYWLYQPAGGPWGDEIECRFGELHDEDFVVRRTERPFSAPETMTESGEEYAFYGTLRGDRNESVLIECPADVYLVVPSRAPLWYLLAAVAGGLVAGLLGLVAVTVTAVRRKRRATVPPPVRTPAPSRVRPSPLWYLAGLPFLLMAMCSCLFGGLNTISGGFSDSFEPPTVGQPRSGTVGDAFRYDDVYLLYADVDEALPTEPITCLLRDTGTQEVQPLPLETDRPLGVPNTVDHDGRTYRFFAAFSLDDPVLGLIECEGNSTLLLRPSNRPQLVVAIAGGIAVGALLVAAAAGIVVSASRRRSAKALGAA